MSHGFRPSGDRVLVQAVEGDEKSKGGIVITNIQGGSMRAKVLAVGPGARDERGQRHAPDCKEGDLILVSEYAGVETRIRGEVYRIVADSDILGVLEA